MTEIQQKWLDALRSGKYKQGRLRLRRGDEFCCLGVACDIYNDTKWKPSWWGSLYEVGDGLTIDLLLNGWLKDLFGLTEDNMETLASMNDEGKTFTEIADFIERKIYKNGND